MSKRVAVTFSTDDCETVQCVEGKKSVILVTDDVEVDLTVINIESGWSEVCEVLEEALLQARRQQAMCLLAMGSN